MMIYRLNFDVVFGSVISFVEIAIIIKNLCRMTIDNVIVQHNKNHLIRLVFVVGFKTFG